MQLRCKTRVDKQQTLGLAHFSPKLLCLRRLLIRVRPASKAKPAEPARRAIGQKESSSACHMNYTTTQICCPPKNTTNLGRPDAQIVISSFGVRFKMQTLRPAKNIPHRFLQTQLDKHPKHTHTTGHLDLAISSWPHIGQLGWLNGKPQIVCVCL